MISPALRAGLPWGRLAVALLWIGCAPRELRGTVTPSADGRTYLIVADDNGGKCGPLTVDGKRWAHAIGAAGAVRPGRHVIACGTDIEVDVDSGTTFRFDYWGP